MPEQVLTVRNLTKSYKPFLLRFAEKTRWRALALRYENKAVRAVQDVSFDIKKGEIVGLIGPNGAGKSTVLKAVAGLIFADAGEITINGVSLEKDKKGALASIGGIIEMPEMYKNLSGIENLKYLAELQGGVSEERISALAKLLKMESRLGDKFRTYSLGMKQRVGIIQAIMHKPALLILDEPTNGLDPQGIVEMRELLRALARKEDIAVLISSHLLSEIQEICDRVAVISGGKIARFDTVAELAHGVREAGCVKFTCDDAVKAAEIAAAMGCQCRVDGAVLSVDCKEEAVADVTRELVLAGVAVFGVNIEKANLEQAFRELTERGEGQ